MNSLKRTWEPFNPFLATRHLSVSRGQAFVGPAYTSWHPFVAAYSVTSRSFSCDKQITETSEGRIRPREERIQNGMRRSGPMQQAKASRREDRGHVWTGNDFNGSRRAFSTTHGPRQKSLSSSPDRLFASMNTSLGRRNIHMSYGRYYKEKDVTTLTF